MAEPFDCAVNNAIAYVFRRWLDEGRAIPEPGKLQQELLAEILRTTGHDKEQRHRERLMDRWTEQMMEAGGQPA